MFRNQELKNALIKIAIPVALQNLLTASLNMIDTIMIGSLGDRAVAAVGLANQWFFIFTLITFGIASGSSIFVAQFYGKKDYNSMQMPIVYSIYLCFTISALFAFLAIVFPEFVMSLFTNDAKTIQCAVPYLKIVGISYLLIAISLPIATAMRSTETATAPLIITSLALFINTSLNYILIGGHFGAPALGVAGAAIATTTARIFETGIILFIMLRGVTKIKIKAHHLKIRPSFFKRYFITILPVIGNEGMWGLGISMYNVIFGRMSNAIVAANQISRNLEQLTTALSIGLGSAVAVVVGKKIGEKNKNSAYSYAKNFMFISVSLGLLLGLFMIIIMPFYLSFYSISSEAKSYASQIITVYGIFMCIKAYNFITIVGVLRSGGDTNFCFFLDAGSTWLVGVLSVFLAAFVFKAPFWVIAICLSFEELVKAIFGLFRFLSKKWLNDLVN